MAINLKKGQSVLVDLKHVIIGLGWNPSTRPGEDFDLDASAFMLNNSHKLLADEYFVFYNNLVSPDGAVKSQGDDRTGSNSNGGDDEVIEVDLARVSFRVSEIVFAASIYEYAERHQNFGQIEDAYIRIVDADNGKELARYDLVDDFANKTVVEFARLYRRGLRWEFEALGVGDTHGLESLVDKYQ